MKKVVIDTSILFSAFISTESKARKYLLQDLDIVIYCPNYILLEFIKHSKRLIKKSRLTEEEFLQTLKILTAQINFFNERKISLDNALKAYYLCKDIDDNDSPFLALCFQLNAEFWTKDDELKDGLKSKGSNNFFEPDF